MLLALTPEMTFKDTTCPAIYVSDDESVESILKRTRSSIAAWASTQDMVTSLEAKMGLLIAWFAKKMYDSPLRLPHARKIGAAFR